MSQHTTDSFTGPDKEHLTSAKAATLILRGIIAAGAPPVGLGKGMAAVASAGAGGADIKDEDTNSQAETLLDLGKTNAADNLKGIKSRAMILNGKSAKRESDKDEQLPPHHARDELPSNPSKKKRKK